MEKRGARDALMICSTGSALMPLNVHLSKEEGTPPAEDGLWAKLPVERGIIQCVTDLRVVCLQEVLRRFLAAVWKVCRVVCESNISTWDLPPGRMQRTLLVITTRQDQIVS